MRFIALLLVVLLSGCMTTKVNILPVVDTERYDETHHFFLFGLFPKKKLIASELCPKQEKLSYFETRTTFWNGVATFFTIGIYSPKTVIARCATIRNKPKKRPTRS